METRDRVQLRKELGDKLQETEKLKKEIIALDAEERKRKDEEIRAKVEKEHGDTIQNINKLLQQAAEIIEKADRMARDAGFRSLTGNRTVEAHKEIDNDEVWVIHSMIQFRLIADELYSAGVEYIQY